MGAGRYVRNATDDRRFSSAQPHVAVGAGISASVYEPTITLFLSLSGTTTNINCKPE